MLSHDKLLPWRDARIVATSITNDNNVLVLFTPGNTQGHHVSPKAKQNVHKSARPVYHAARKDED